MTRTHKIETWLALLTAIAIVAALLLWGIRKPLILRGAVLVQDSDPRKQQAIPGVTVSVNVPAVSDTKTDSSGFFALKLPKLIRRGYPIVLSFRDQQHRPLDLQEYASDRLYVARLIPLSSEAAPVGPEVKVANIRIRYTVKAVTELNVGSAAKAFEVENKGNAPCKSQPICSPDGKWKAAIGKMTLDAGAGNQFRDTRTSCIAGPCPFTKIEKEQFSQDGQVYTVSIRDWSDSTTFLSEAEVFRPMVSQSEHWSYPVIFGQGFSFTLPANAQSVSLQADLDGQSIIFPLGPTVALSWANCIQAAASDHGRVYRCTAKSNYRIQ